MSIHPDGWMLPMYWPIFTIYGMIEAWIFVPYLY